MQLWHFLPPLLTLGAVKKGHFIITRWRSISAPSSCTAPGLGNAAAMAPCQFRSVPGVGPGARVVWQQRREPNSVPTHDLCLELLVAMHGASNTNTSRPALPLAPDFASALGWLWTWLILYTSALAHGHCGEHTQEENTTLCLTQSYFFLPTYFSFSLLNLNCVKWGLKGVILMKTLKCSKCKSLWVKETWK